MKTVKIITAFVLASMLALSTAAANFVPSAEYYKPGTVVTTDPETGEEYIGKIVDKDGNTEEYLGEDDIIVNFDKDDEDIKDATEQLTNNDLEDIVKDFEDEWKDATGGAPTENAGITNVFEVIIPGSIAEKVGEGDTIEIQIKVDGITDEDKFIVIGQKEGSDEWGVYDYTIDENGVITIIIDDVDPNGDNSYTFAIVVDTTTDPDPSGQSPQTGVAKYSVAVIATAVVLCGVAFVVIKKASKNKTAA